MFNSAAKNYKCILMNFSRIVEHHLVSQKTQQSDRFAKRHRVISSAATLPSRAIPGARLSRAVKLPEIELTVAPSKGDFTKSEEEQSPFEEPSDRHSVPWQAIRT